jgi:hypothetical protein
MRKAVADSGEAQRLIRTIPRKGLRFGGIVEEEQNPAARLEALTEPDGISASGVVRDEIHDTLLYPSEDTGEQSVKNVARPLAVHAFDPEDVADLPPADMPIAIPRRRRRAVAAIVAAAAFGPSGSIATRAICSLFKPRSRAASRSRSTSS